MGKRKLNADGNERRSVRLTLVCSIDVPPGTTEEQIIDYLDANDIEWSPQCELVDYGFGE